jgi:hypothetical protein
MKTASGLVKEHNPPHRPGSTQTAVDAGDLAKAAVVAAFGSCEKDITPERL